MSTDKIEPVNHEHYGLYADEKFDGEETVDPEQVSADLQECLRDIKAWRAGESRMRVTVMEDGVSTVYYETAAETEEREARERSASPALQHTNEEAA